MIRQVRRCQGWTAIFTPAGHKAVQCPEEAKDGKHCAHHKGQVIVEWMDKVVDE